MSIPTFFIFPIILLVPIILSILGILQLDNTVMIGLIVFWIVMMILDISVIGRNEKYLKYETSFILTFFYKKTNLRYAIILTILSEIGLIVLSSFVFVHSFDIQIMAIFCGFVGLIHIDGFYKTKKFIRCYNIE